MKYQIIPTIIAKDQKELDLQYNKIEKYIKIIQIDVMDGKFVKNKSNWFKLKLNKKTKYEAHLMVDNPEEWIKENYKQFDVIIANFEKVKKPEELIKFVKSKKKKIGFAINPETKVNLLVPYLNKLDRILVLMVHPGQYGSSFVTSDLEKIRILRMYYQKDIEVDGHQDPEILRLCKKAGANLFAVGSYISKSENVKESIKELEKAIRK